MSSELSEQEIDAYKAAFNMFDSDGNGRIVVDEVGDVLKMLGQEVTADQLQILLNVSNRNDDKTIDFPQFLQLMNETKNGQSREEYFRRAFKVFDKDKSGYISREELLEMSNCMLGEKLTKKELDEMLKEIDTDEDGRVSYDEFLKMIEQQK